jgi:outer membrane autotransporter protein
MHRSPLRLALVVLILGCALGLRATAATNIWTNTLGAADGEPAWVNFPLYGANWSLGRVPTATDDVVFTLPYVPLSSSKSAFAGTPVFPYLASGQVVILYPGNHYPPALVANSLTFLGNYTLATAAQIDNPLHFTYGFLTFSVDPLQLTSGLVTVGPRFTATIDAPLSSLTGTIIKTGPGTLILNNSPSTIAAVLGNLLIAQGTVGGNFTVTGSLIEQKHTALSIQIAGPNVYDGKIVQGHARLKGDLMVSLLNGFQPKAGEKFTLLQAGSISGKFADVEVPVWDNLTLRPFYSKQSVTLKAVVDSFANLSGLTANEYAVGRSLDSAINDPRATGLLNYLYGRNLRDLPKNLEKLTPDGFTSMLTLGPAFEQVQSLNLQRHTEDVRSGAAGFSASNLAINGSNPFYSGSFDIATGVAGPNGNAGKEVKEAKEVAPAENRWGAFLSGTGEWVNVSGTDNARGFDLVSGGFTLGVDYKVCPHFAIGLAAGYVGTTADLTDHGRIWVNGGKLGLYATTFAGGWYADVAAFGGYNGYSTRRSTVEGEARGNTDGGELDALFGTGYDFKSGGLTFGPTATFNYTYIGFKGFTEHNSLAPLDIHGADASSYRSAFGARVSYDCKCGNVIIRPELRAAWQHEYGRTSAAITSSFAGGFGDPFTAHGPQLGRDSALIGAGFAVQLNDRLTTYLYYDGQLGRENFESNSVMGGVRVTF